ncbi:MAG TPA: restriction endonuclease subunit S [Burkholderiales bacterium]|nr:restriction endonuclease subunit S [Burkholderiales bacterium]
MNKQAAELLERHFDIAFAAPKGIKKLRELILTLAMQGKLATQDPSDPPVSQLLKEIDAEKKRLVKEGKIKSQKPLPEIKREEVPYPLPFGWEWAKLGSISLSSDSGWSPQCLPEVRTGNNWGVLKVSAVSWGSFNPNENKTLPPGKDPKPEYEVMPGDFLLSRANTDELVARSVVVRETPPNLMMSDKIVRFTLTQYVNKLFINTVNSSNFARAYYASNASGTSSSMKNVSREVMLNLPVPLPPIAEQHRIFAKIDQLMARCDTIEKQIDASTDKQTKLLNAVMAQI